MVALTSRKNQPLRRGQPSLAERLYLKCGHSGKHQTVETPLFSRSKPCLATFLKARTVLPKTQEDHLRGALDVTTAVKKACMTLMKHKVSPSLWLRRLETSLTQKLKRGCRAQLKTKSRLHDWCLESLYQNATQDRRQGNHPRL